MGPPLELHSSRMWPFNHSRTSADLEHERRLPPGEIIVEGVLEGPDADGKFLVKWRGVAEPRWEWPAGLTHLTLFVEYCEKNGVVMAEGRPVQWRPGSLHAPVERVSRHGYAVCKCGKEVKDNRAAVTQHLKSQAHVKGMRRAAEAAAATAPGPVAPAAPSLSSESIAAASVAAGGGAAPLRSSSRTRRE